jgi:hypothetical protein
MFSLTPFMALASCLPQGLHQRIGFGQNRFIRLPPKHRA